MLTIGIVFIVCGATFVIVGLTTHIVALSAVGPACLVLGVVFLGMSKSRARRNTGASG
jgi:hypothetical protein